MCRGRLPWHDHQARQDPIGSSKVPLQGLRLKLHGDQGHPVLPEAQPRGDDPRCPVADCGRLAHQQCLPDQGSEDRHDPLLGPRSRGTRRRSRGVPARQAPGAARLNRWPVGLCVEQGFKKNYRETETSGSFWRSTVTDIDTRLRGSRGLEKDETKASVEPFESLRCRGHSQAPPPSASDGWGSITEAMIKVWGRIPPYRGRGCPPTRKLPGDDWQYLQMIKHRDKRGRLMEIEAKVVFGAEQAVRQLLGENTAYAERKHLTMRHFNGRLVRKSLAFSKKVRMLAVSTAWEDLYYNFVRFHKSLRKPSRQVGKTQWIQQTPAMAANLARQVHTVRSLLFAVVPKQHLKRVTTKMRLKDKVVIVAGAGPGIGEATVKIAAEEGASIAVGVVYTPGFHEKTVSQTKALYPERFEGFEGTDREWLEHRIKAATPLGRSQTGEDIGHMIAFLLSEEAKNITGQSHYIDGGRFM